MVKRLERLLIWLVATATGAGMLYAALTAPKEASSILLGILIVLGVAIGAVGILGFATEVVQFVNRVLPDAPSAPTYQQVADRPRPIVVRRLPKTNVSAAPELSTQTRNGEPSTPRPERIFVDVSPKYLRGLFKENLAVQADKLVAPYFGKWLRVSGKLSEVRGTTSMQVSFEQGYPDEPLLLMYFDRQWEDRLAILQKGQQLTIIGKLERVDSVAVTLGECELVAVGPVSPP